MRNLTWELIGTLVLAIIIFLLLRFMLGSFTVVGDSMEPGLQKGEHLLVYKLAYQFSGPNRGDIVYYRSPDGAGGQLKRVIAVPGDTLEIRDGAVYVNQQKLDEPYIQSPPQYTLQASPVPPDRYFILGDNRNNSSDSSSGWTVPRENILGRAWLFTWPPSHWGGAGSYPLETHLKAAE